MPRGRKRKAEAANRATELRDQAREVAGQSGEALKDFAETTGVAAKEFAGKAREAAKDLVDAIERASKGVEEPGHRRRGRRFLRASIVVGVGVAIFANERVRDVIGGAVRRARGGEGPPDVWRPESETTGNGEVREPAEEKS